MANREQMHDLKVELTYATATTSSGAQKSSAVRNTGYDAVCHNLHIGATLAAGLAYKVQESDTTTDGDFTDAAADSVVADTITPIASSTIRIAYVGQKPYSRLVATPGGSTILSMTAVKGMASFQPVANGVVNDA